MQALTDAELAALLRDDVPYGDLTTQALAIGPRGMCLEFRARQPMRVCGAEEALRLFELAGAQGQLHRASGDSVAGQELILQASGSADSLHRAWKTAQNLVEWASGLASATAAIVEQAQGLAVACTRKNVPGAKSLSVKAIRAGGGILHRLGLSESILVFAEHRVVLDEPPAQTIQRLRRAQPEKKIVVEVSSPQEARTWIDAGADVLQLEKFSPQDVALCRAAVDALALQRPPLLAAAGGVRADNAGAYAAAGADMLVTSAPYTAPPKDVQVVFRAAD